MGTAASTQPCQLCNLDAMQSGALSPAVLRQAFDINLRKYLALCACSLRIQSLTRDRVTYRNTEATVGRL
jgi:hypothetical protein